MSCFFIDVMQVNSKIQDGCFLIVLNTVLHEFTSWTNFFAIRILRALSGFTYAMQEGLMMPVLARRLYASHWWSRSYRQEV
jgi:hypothetical protein